MIAFGLEVLVLSLLADCAPGSVLIDDAQVLIGGQWQSLDLRVKNGQIEAVDPALLPRQDERVIAAAGHFVIPGLIDAHAHLFEVGGPYPDGWNEPPYDRAMLMNARALLQSGVTTARIHLFDLNHGPEFARRAADACHPSPRLSIGGPGIFGNRPNLAARQVRGLPEAAMAEEVLADYAAAGVDWVALHELADFPRDTLAATVAAARRHGIRLMADGSSQAAVELAIHHGLDTIEYLPEDGPLRQETLERLAASHVAVVAPIGFYRRIARATSRPSAVAELGLPQRLPVEHTQTFEAEFDAWLAADGYYDDAAELLPVREQSFQDLRAAGIRTIPGSDAGSAGQYHDRSIWIELEAWQALGVTRVEALQAATELSAAALGLTEVGVIAPGKRADLVIFSGAPAAETMVYVMKGGVLHFSGTQSP